MVKSFIVIAILTLLATILAWRATQRPSEGEREETLVRRLSNGIGPANGRYEGDKYTFDLINVEVDEQTDTIYRLIRYLTGNFKGITTIVVRFEQETAPDTTKIESHPWITDGEFELLELRSEADELTFVIPTTEPRSVREAFDSMRRIIDQSLSPEGPK